MHALVILKPDAVRQGLEASIVAYLEAHGLRLLAYKPGWITPEKRLELYRDFHLNSRTHWDLGSEFYTLGPAAFLIFAGEPSLVSRLKGSFIPWKSEPDTIRGRFNAINPVFNLVHTSDDAEKHTREAPIFFEAEELERLHAARALMRISPGPGPQLLSFEPLLVRVKLQLAVRADHRAVLETAARRFRELEDRRERRRLLFELLEAESRLVDDELSRALCLRESFTVPALEELLARLAQAGVRLDRWDAYLLKSSIYYLRFE